MTTSTLGFLAANPRDKQIVLRQTEELQRLKGALASSPLARRVLITERLTAQLRDLEALCGTTQPEVFHFSGFEASREGGILLEDAEGYSYPLGTEELLGIFRAHAYRPRLVFLNACNTSPTAQALIEFADAVISYRSDVTDDYCNVFADALYRAMFGRCAIGPAFQAALKSVADDQQVMRTIHLHRLDDSPAVLHVRDTIDSSTHVPFTARPLSVFISYGGLDQAVAERLHDALVAEGVDAFVFSRDAPAGTSLQELMYDGVNSHDWMVLLCSRTSLSRPGVRNEIEEAFRRVSRLGGRNRIVPLALDDYVFGAIDQDSPVLGSRLRDLVIKDLAVPLRSKARFIEFVRSLVDDLTGPAS